MSYYSSRSGGGGAATAGARNEPRTLPPWDVRLPQPSSAERLREALGSGSLIDAEAKRLTGNTKEVTEKKLFALYNAMASLSAIASSAADKSTPETRLSSLNRRFEAALAEIYGFAGTVESDKIVIVPGEKSRRADLDIAVPRANSQYTTKIIHRTGTASPMAGLTGTEQFTIAVKKGGVTTNININLAALGTAEVKMDDLINLINTELSNAGMATRFRRERIIVPSADGKIPSTPPQTWGLKIEGTAAEVLSFSAPAASPAIYLAGTSGKPGEAIGQFLKLDLSTGTPKLTASANIEPSEATANAVASAIDSQGNSYVVGNSNGNFGSQINQSEQDVYLTKYDSTGKLLWTRLLGATAETEGFSVAVDASDNVVVAGRAKGSLTGSSVTGTNASSFVVKFSGIGEEKFIRHIGPQADDGALAITTGTDGSVYLAGYTKGALGAGIAHGGGEDGYVTKLSATGTLVYHRQFGTAAGERVTGIATTGDGNIVTVSVENGRAIARKFDAASAVAATFWERDLGDLAGGEAAAITVDGGNVYIGGTTKSGSFGGGTVEGAFAGGSDGFVVRLNEANGAFAKTTFIGGPSTDRIKDIAVAGGEVYIAGDTTGDLGGGFTGSVNGFAAKLNASGGLAFVHQYAGRAGFGRATSLTVDLSGSSVLDVLGLPKGRIDYTQPRSIPAQTTVRAGQEFSIAVNGGRAKRIVIEDDETLRSLTLKINTALLLEGKASLRRVPGGDSIRIEPKENARIDILAGPAGKDALIGLGLDPGTIVTDGAFFDPDKVGEDDAETPAGPLYVGLGLERGLSIRTRKDAIKVATELQSVLSSIRSAHRELSKDPVLEAFLKQQSKSRGPVPEYLSAQLANYNSGLQRLVSIA